MNVCSEFRVFFCFILLGSRSAGFRMNTDH